MGIDRIGRGGAPPAPDASGAGQVAEKGAVDPTFSVERPGAAEGVGAAATAATAPTSALARLRAGELDLGGYVDLKVEEATRGLHGISAAELDEIKRTLRDQMETDPSLLDLVQRATGQTPSPPEE